MVNLENSEDKPMKLSEELQAIRQAISSLGAVIEYMKVVGGNRILYKEVLNRLEEITKL